ncbi:hypothetical protein [Sphingomonas panaciterrae]|uniref:hypothetical protein n=1 Tax=Sphingomonas panaciterrae TaxID=1462999 RepID=UPI002FF1C349
MLGFGFGPGSVATVLAGGVPLPIEPPVPTIPPADWRMPATVTTSAGLAGSQPALQAAQQSAASKSRPSVTVPTSTTEWIEWQVAASSTYLSLSFMGGNNGTVTVAVDGVDQGYTPQFPPDHASGPSGKRQGIAIPPGAARTIRLTCVAGAADRSIAPLLHQMPARGPADSYVVNGASREDQGLKSAEFEAAIIAAYPGRDPIVFNWARSGQTADYVAAAAPSAIALYRHISSYALVGSILGNNITGGRPYQEGYQAPLTAYYDAIGQAYSDAGIRLALSNTSYRAYSGVTPETQVGGSREYNDAVVHPMILKWSPRFYDAALLRAKGDEYVTVMRARSTLTDSTHGAEVAQRKALLEGVFPVIYGAPFVSQAERLVAALEAEPTGVNDNEALYALTAMVPSAGRNALVARYAVAHRRMLYADALAATQNAEAAKTQAAKDAATAAVQAARAGGYTPASNLDALDARIAAIVIVAAIVIGVNFKTDTDVPGWNNVSRSDPGLSTLGAIIIADLIDDKGQKTGFRLELVASSGALSTTNTLGAQGAPAGAPFPDAVLLRGMFASAATSRTFRISSDRANWRASQQGISSTTRSSTSTTHYDVPGRTRQTLSARGNVSDYAHFLEVEPEAFEEAGKTRHGVNLAVSRGSGYLDINAIRYVIIDH